MKTRRASKHVHNYIFARHGAAAEHCARERGYAHGSLAKKVRSKGMWEEVKVCVFFTVLVETGWYDTGAVEAVQNESVPAGYDQCAYPVH